MQRPPRHTVGPLALAGVQSALLMALALALLCMLALPLSAATPLTIHLVAHSHEDAGYEKTADEYFYGTNQSIRNTGVRYRMDSILHTLAADPTRRFIQVESAFLNMWWETASAAQQSQMQSLVAAGQMELVGGGWVMHDGG